MTFTRSATLAHRVSSMEPSRAKELSSTVRQRRSAVRRGIRQCAAASPGVSYMRRYSWRWASRINMRKRLKGSVSGSAAFQDLVMALEVRPTERATVRVSANGGVRTSARWTAWRREERR